ncbi:putative MFS-type transporter EfpA [Paraconexibacter sp. AEG42_29]|uniref:MFS-type transporter EfpA n=1 Tax=Paraconexibacter sp. AEG42_29 TaxID=2997339 RepID=A0AAU7AXR0_9ACTN
MPSLETPREKNRALVLLAMTQFMIVIDASITNVALPSIGADLKIAQADLSWIVNAYTLTFGGFLLLGGRLADLVGRRRMFIVGMGVFGLGSLLGGLAGSESFLVGARALQGLGAALVSPAALSLVTTIFKEGAERNRALGVWGAVAGAGGAAGVLLGGVLTEIDWRLVLFVNVPVAVAVIVAAPRVLLESKADTDVTSFDIPGAVTVTAGLALLVYALVDAETAGWDSSTTILRIAAAVVLIVLFIGIESRTKHPLMPFSIFRLRTLRGANIAGMLTGMSLFSMFLFISFYLQYVLGYSALKTGLAYLPLSVVIIICAGAASQLVTKVGFKPTLIGGLMLVAGGLFWFAQIDPDGGYVTHVLGPSMMAGAGLGFTFVPVTIAAVTGTTGEEAGLASGLINTSQQIGGALGVAILVSISTSRIGEFAPAAQRSHEALTAGYSRAFTVGACFAVVAAILSLIIISSKDSKEQVEAAKRGEAIPAAA